MVVFGLGCIGIVAVKVFEVGGVEVLLWDDFEIVCVNVEVVGVYLDDFNCWDWGDIVVLIFFFGIFLNYFKLYCMVELV